MNIRLLAIDFDGVLLNSEPYHRDARKTLIGEYCRGIAYDSAASVGMSVESFYRRQMRKAGVRENEEMNASKLAKMHFDRVFNCLVQNGVKANAGAAVFLEELDRLGIRMAVASSSSTDYISKCLKHIGLLERFELLCCGDDVEHAKPNPDIYLRVIKLSGVPSSDIAAVEDSVAGVEAARRAGIRCFGYEQKANDTGVAGCIKTVKHFSEIIDTLQQWEGIV